MVSLLLNYGADITLCNSKGQSVLDFAPDSMRPLLLGMLNSLKHLFGWRWRGRGRQWTIDSECPQSASVQRKSCPIARD